MATGNFFEISADFDLKVKPAWLKGFRQKYDLPYNYHNTFKTTTNFKSKDLPNLKTELKNLANNHQSFLVIFNKLSIKLASSGWCIMIQAKPNKKLATLQKEISAKFSKYGKHITKERESFEKNFHPHITIARHLTPEKLKKAKNELKKNLLCEASVDSLTLYQLKNGTSQKVKTYKFSINL